jgi:hypothetical protein
MTTNYLYKMNSESDKTTQKSESEASTETHDVASTVATHGGDTEDEHDSNTPVSKPKFSSWLDAAKASLPQTTEVASSHVVSHTDHFDLETKNDFADTVVVEETKEGTTETEIDTTITWNGGKRPFEGAIYAYLTEMRRKLGGCIRHLQNRDDHEYADVKVDPNQLLEVPLDNGTVRNYKFHVVHYGPMNSKAAKRHWRDRDNIWGRMEIHPPFRTLQVEMLQKGFFLLDESDPSKSFNMRIRLHQNKPAGPLYLWHSFGVIPTLGSVHPVAPPTVVEISDEVCEDTLDGVLSIPKLVRQTAMTNVPFIGRHMVPSHVPYIESTVTPESKVDSTLAPGAPVKEDKVVEEEGVFNEPDVKESLQSVKRSLEKEFASTGSSGDASED